MIEKRVYLPAERIALRIELAVVGALADNDPSKRGRRVRDVVANLDSVVVAAPLAVLADLGLAGEVGGVLRLGGGSGEGRGGEKEGGEGEAHVDLLLRYV